MKEEIKLKSTPDCGCKECKKHKENFIHDVEAVMRQHIERIKKLEEKVKYIEENYQEA